MVADISGVMSQATLQRLGPSLPAQASPRSQPTQQIGNDGASSLVSLSEQAKRMSATEVKTETQDLAAQVRDARAAVDTSPTQQARLRGDIQAMENRNDNPQQAGVSAVDPATQGQSPQQAAVASYLAMSQMR